MTEQGMAWKETLGSDACPDLDELFRILGEEKPAREFEEHLERCPRCATEAAMYREFESGGLRPGEQDDIAWVVRRLQQEDPAAAPPRSQRGDGGWISSLARRLSSLGWRPLAPLAAAIALAMVLWTWSPGVPDVVDVSDAPTLRAGQIESLEPTGVLTAAPTELRWEAVPGAAVYQVRVLEIDRTELWRADTTEASVAMPADIREKMVIGRRVLWEVTALDSAGAKLGGVGTADFAIRAKGGPNSQRG